MSIAHECIIDAIDTGVSPFPLNYDAKTDYYMTESNIVRNIYRFVLVSYDLDENRGGRLKIENAHFDGRIVSKTAYPPQWFSVFL